nr:hypothetical protein [Tanacetum cinerariifolium]
MLFRMPREIGYGNQNGNPQQALKDKGVIDSGCSRHMTRNISYLSDFEEINRGYVAFGGNLKGGKITGKGKIRIGKLDFDDVYFLKELKFNLFSPDENHVLVKVPRENNMYNVDLKNIVPSGDLTCLFAKATLDESNLWHRRVLVTKPHNKTPYELLLGRTPSIGFMRPFGCHVTILNTLDPLGKFNGKADEGFLVGYSSMNYQPVIAGNQPNSSTGIQDNFDAGKEGKEPVSTQQYVLLPLWSTGSKDPKNKDTNVAFVNKEPESEVHASPSSSDTPKKHDEKAKKEAKGKSPVELSIGVRDLSDEFEEFSVNNTNMVHAARVRDLSDEFEEFSVNNTNRVNAASTPVTAFKPNSTNSANNFNAAGPSNIAVTLTFKIKDKENVGAEADFSNLETIITVSPIPTTRVHKDHPVTQIIGVLSSAPQTRSMERMVKEQGGLTQMNDEDFNTCMFACFLSQKEPKR